jgi:Contractile injection system tube protein
MSAFPGSPRLLKGAIVGMDPLNPLASVIVFQYNPDTLTRTLTAQTTGGGSGERGEAMRLKGPPQETIKVDIELDATDQLERGDGVATTLGLSPALASLEMLLYPKSAIVIADEVLAAVGVIEIIPPEAPLTLFIWGIKRVLPVRITDFSITEEAFDPALNPIRAKASVGLRVLSYTDLGLPSVGGALYMVHQVASEVMATMSGASNVAGAATGSFNVGIG